MAFIGADVNRWSPHAEVERPEPILTPLKPDGTLIAVIEMSPSSWLVAGIVPGVERQPSKKLEVDENALLKLLNRWREEAHKAGQGIERIAVAFEAGRDGFWLARWLRARDIEAHVIHASSIAVSREHRRAKTDRLDTELLKRSFLGWLRGERDHCKMVAILKDEDAKETDEGKDAPTYRLLKRRVLDKAHTRSPVAVVVISSNGGRPIRWKPGKAGRSCLIHTGGEQPGRP